MFNCLRHKYYRDHISYFQGKENQSLLLEPILNDTKQVHQPDGDRNALLLTRNPLSVLPKW